MLEKNKKKWRHACIPLSKFEEGAYHFAYDPFLFFQKKHVLLQPFDNAQVALALSKGKVIARHYLMAKTRSEDTLYSPSRGSFGGVEFADNMSYEALQDFLSFIKGLYQMRGAQKVILKGYPLAYHPSAPVLHHLLLSQGFEVTQTDLSQHIDLRYKHPTAFHHSTQRRIDKCTRANFVFQQVNQPDQETLRWVYEFVQSARLRKGFPISLDLDSFLKLFHSFPDQHQIFWVKDGDTVVALTVTIAINHHILYNFYPADHPDYLQYSPSAFLMDHLVQYAQANQYDFLDLGVSTDGGSPNFGLLRFKQNFGSIVSHKYTYQLLL